MSNTERYKSVLSDLQSAEVLLMSQQNSINPSLFAIRDALSCVRRANASLQALETAVPTGREPQIGG